MQSSLRPFAASALVYLSACALSSSALCACAQGAQLDAAGSGGFGGAGSTGGPTTSSTSAGGAGPATTTFAATGGAGPTTAATTADVTTGAQTSAQTTGASMGGGGLLFSEYVEGSSFNKAVEISNRGSSPASLQGCQIDHYANGATTTSSPTMLNVVTLQPGKTFVVCHTQFSQPALCDQLDGKMTHTGNDVVALTCNGAPVDVIGQIGSSAVWGTPPTTTQDATLRRKCSVTSGDTNANDAFDPSVEWNGFPADTFSDLGQDTCP